MQHSKAERLICRILFLDPPIDIAESKAPETSKAERAFGLSVAFSGVRCILQYVVLPFILPIFGIAANAAVPIVLIITLVAIVAIITTMRRLWRIGYKYRWQYLIVGLMALAIQFAFLIFDTTPSV